MGGQFFTAGLSTVHMLSAWNREESREKKSGATVLTPALGPDSGKNQPDVDFEVWGSIRKTDLMSNKGRV